MPLSNSLALLAAGFGVRKGNRWGGECHCAPPRVSPVRFGREVSPGSRGSRASFPSPTVPPSRTERAAAEDFGSAKGAPGGFDGELADIGESVNR